MVGTAVAAALALGNAIYGGIKSSQANNKARKLLQQQREDNKKWYDTEMAKDYTLRTDTQAAINRQRELLEEQYKQARARQAVSGGSDESVALAKEAANRSLSDTMTDIAANASARKDAVEQQYLAQDAALNQQQAQSYQQQAAQAAQAASQAVNAGISLTGQYAAEPKISKPDLYSTSEALALNKMQENQDARLQKSLETLTKPKLQTAPDVTFDINGRKKER